MPDSERRLRRQVRRLRELRAADAEEIALHQATMENSHLRRQLADRHAVVRALPTQAPLGE